MADDIKLDPDPGSTIQATEEYKAAWHAEYDDVEEIEAPAEPVTTAKKTAKKTSRG